MADGYDVVIEAAGTSSALAEAVERCRPGGTVVLVGTYWDSGTELPGQMLSMKEITLVPSSMYGRVGPSRDFEVAASILADRPEIGGALITHRFPLDAAVEAFAVARDRAAGAIKVVLEP
jgi:threonine dehydrogenase-like Zn-dependent dehydrogenase